MDREKIEEVYKWDLSKIYGNIEEFNNDIEVVKKKLKLLSSYEGIKYDSNNLYELLSMEMHTQRVLEKLEVYASLLCDEDTSINKNMELKESMIILNILRKSL